MRVRLYPTGQARTTDVIRIDTFPAVVTLSPDGQLSVNGAADHEALCLIDQDHGNLIIKDCAARKTVLVNGNPIIAGGLLPGDMLSVDQNSYVISYERVTSRPPARACYRIAGVPEFSTQTSDV